MVGPVARLLPYALAFFSSLCIMILELVSSRLVARHVGSSLTVWTSVIGIILGGICLGNVLGGRLADRVRPRKAVGPLFALGALFTLTSLWVNAGIGKIIPAPEALNWELRTVIVVTLDFLIPATVLGMVGPVVAKMAVEQAKKAGSAIGDVYFWGAVGSIVGTFLAGFVLMYYVSSSTIVLVVGAALALLAATLIESIPGRVLGVITAALLGAGSIAPLVRAIGPGGIDLGSYQINFLALAGNITALILGLVGLGGLVAARQADSAMEPAEDFHTSTSTDSGGLEHRTGLADLAALAFLASLGFMALEMAAGRLVSRHLGSSIYGWTSVIAVLLAGLSLGNLLGGRIANRVKHENQASWLFLVASLFVLTIILLETPPKWLVDVLGARASHSALSSAITWSSITVPFLGPIPLSWPFRVLLMVTLVFLIPAITMGTVSPVVAKLAIDRLRRYNRTGRAIGQVYAWGMVGSILGTFLTGFVLIDLIGTKGVLLVLATALAFAATILGSVGHAVWAGIPLGLCLIAFLPGSWFQRIGQDWGIREEQGNPATTEDSIAYADESDYYYIKVTNDPEQDEDDSDVTLQKRTLVLDNLIHGYFILGHPERLDYDYEHIYALIAYRAAKAHGKIELAPGGGAAVRVGGAARVPRLPEEVFASQEKVKDDVKPKTDEKKVPAKGKADDKSKETDLLETGSDARPLLPRVAKSTLKTLFLGGGAYTFQRHMQFAYPGTEVDVAEIDRAVTNANFAATGLPRDTSINTTFGDARQFVERNQGSKQYDIIFGDAFNDFSVPWHLTTREFNEKMSNMMSPDGVYMINIIDVYESDAHALKKAQKKIDGENSERTKASKPALTKEEEERIRSEALVAAQRYGGFLGAWTRTAQQTFPHVYIFGTDNATGSGLRETFVVVASKRALDLDKLGRRPDDPKFYHNGKLSEPAPYSPEDEKSVVESRSRGIILTDDYAPVENLLAPVAETRGTD